MGGARVPEGEATAELVIRRSVFSASVCPVATEAAARDRVRAVRADHPRAGHVAWAYVVGPPEGSHLGMSDDGEPRGTAGRPILALLKHRGVTNAVVTVARVFGGVMLGKGGLVRAYTDSALAALARASFRDLVVERRITVRCGYESHRAVRAVLEDLGVRGLEETFSQKAGLTGHLEESRVEEAVRRIADVTRGAAETRVEEAQE